MRFFEETFGCTMNQGESRELVSALMDLGHVQVPTAEEADIVLINTCIVIEPTELKIMKRLRSINQMGKMLVIAGCMPAVNPSMLRDEFPDALLLEPTKYPQFKTMANEWFGIGGPASNPSDLQISGILPVSQGCLGNCTYCLTKAARGDLTSYPAEVLMNKARELIAGGSKELLVTAQDSGCYGFDKGTDIASLLNGLTSIEGTFFIRVGMMNPDSLDPVLDKVILAYSSSKVYKFLHLPVQSGSQKVLSLMNRGYSPETFLSQVRSFRKVHARMSIATDIITGFPGEKDEDHELSKELLLKARPNIVNVTRYSPRPGTSAARAREQVPTWISKERSREMTKLRFEIAAEHYSQFVGMSVSALVTERGKEGTMVARTVEYVPVAVPSKGIGLGSMIVVDVTGSTSTHLVGKPI